MQSLFIKILIITFLLLIIASCGDSTKNKDQSDISTGKDSLSAYADNNFLFLTEWFDKVGVYKYNFEKKKYSPVWWHPRENVVMLISESENHPAFFLTAEKMGIRANFPFFNRLKLFRISPDLIETKQIDDMGSGLQFTSRWNDAGNLEVIYTSVDKTTASYVNQYTRIYDHYGKLIDSNIKTYDIQKSGFPRLLPPQNSTISPSGDFGVSFIEDSVFLKSVNTDSLKFITILNLELNKIKWSKDEKYLFISTLSRDNETVKTKNPETAELFIYSLSADSVIRRFGGTGVKNFFSMNDLLIFDDGFGYNSVINIFNLTQNKIIDVIDPKHGCGLVFIPQM